MEAQSLMLQAIIEHLGIQTLTPIQEQVIEQWDQATDLIALSPTGSGKTFAFALSTLPLLDLSVFTTQCLILCPTRELANQVAEEMRKAAATLANVRVLTLIGGEPMGPQIQSLKGACQIVIGTPGRVREHADKRRLNLSKVHTRVLDEADRMLEMGMVDEVEAILSYTPKNCRTGFFSATFTQSATTLCENWMTNPIRIDVREQDNQPDIKQQIYIATRKEKQNALFALLSDSQPEKTIVFVRTKQGTQTLFEKLKEKGFPAISIHGDLDQYQRERGLTKFRLNAANILVATDVAARGLDLPSVDLVVSYDLSENDDTHRHRIGRTGRAGASGLAIALVEEKELDSAKSRCSEPDSGLTSKVSGVQHLRFHANRIQPVYFQAIEIRGGKKDKLRKGDIVGSLIKDAAVPPDDVGEIILGSTRTFLAVKTRSAKKVLQHFREGKIKGRRYTATKI